MNFLSIDSLSKYFADNYLFKDVNIGVSQGEKIALIGPNGCGKTTLLRIVAGMESADKGEVTLAKGLTVGYLPQNPDFGAAKTVAEAIFESDNLMFKAVAAYQKALINPEDTDALTSSLEKMDALQAWDYESKISQVLGKLGVHDTEKALTELSGGQLKRVALARMLVLEPDFIILDEPTNHLDMETIQWLEDRISSQNMTLLMVTHDRYFLDATCNAIWEIDRQGICRYEGDYTYFLEKKQEKEIQLQTEYDKNKNLYKNELEWVRKQPRARGTKAKYRLEAFEETKAKLQNKTVHQAVEIGLSADRQGKKVMEMEDVNMAFGDTTILKDFSYVFRKKEKVGIVGENGAGKSTFLNLLTGALQPDSGVIDAGLRTNFGYYKQNTETYDENMKVIEAVQAIAEYIEMEDGSKISATTLLTQFLFSSKKQYDYIRKLSGGEKRRLQLLLVLMSNPNFLILDEPTNDLDIVTLNVLEEFLLNFPGCLLIVSHDRYFLDKLVDHIFIFEGNGQITDFPGNYSQYRAYKEMEKELLAAEKDKNQTKFSANDKKTTEKPKTKLSFKEKKEFEDLEKEIAALETQKEEFTKKMGIGTLSHNQIREQGLEMENLCRRIEEKTNRWIELSEYA